MSYEFNIQREFHHQKDHNESKPPSHNDEVLLCFFQEHSLRWSLDSKRTPLGSSLHCH